MTQEELKMELEELAVRFSKGWHEGIKIDASDIMLLNEAAQALAQPERHELQAKGEHPAPCARHCEANAFQIVIKNLKAQLAQPEQEPVKYSDYEPDGVHHNKPEQDTVQRLSALVRAQQITIDKLEAQPEQALCDLAEDGVCETLDCPNHPIEQEPVAYATKEDFHRELERRLKHIREEMKIKSVTMRCKDYDIALPIIDTDFGRVLVGQVFTPPQRKPLTDKAITQVIDSMPKKMKGFMVDWDLYEFARAIEAKPKENT
jgi:hypothetical protein